MLVCVITIFIYYLQEALVRRHIEKSTGRGPLSFSKLINNLKSHQPLQPMFNVACKLF